MWCLLYIAIAGIAPPTDCSIVYESSCQTRAEIVNAAEWQENVSEISYLAVCVSATTKARYYRTRLVDKVIKQ